MTVTGPLTAVPDLSVVVPTYGGVATLETLVTELEAALTPMGLDFEVVVVNDASPDDTADVLADLASEHDWVHGITMLRNHGQAVATMCGLAHARGRLVATMDDDLQHPPDQLPVLVGALTDDPTVDAVVGSWARDEGMLRNAGSWMHGWADRLAHDTPRGFRHTAFRVLRRPLVDAMVANRTRTPAIGPLLTQTTTRVGNVRVRHDERRAGTSNFRIGHGVAFVVSNFIKGSTLPLRMVSGFGLLVAVLAFLAGGVFLARAITGVATPPGWLSAFLASVFFGGMILVQIGLVGQYIHVIVREVRGAPRWTVRSRTPGLPPPAVHPSNEPRPPEQSDPQPQQGPSQAVHASDQQLQLQDQA